MEPAFDISKQQALSIKHEKNAVQRVIKERGAGKEI